MASGRIRTIKPELLEDEKTAGLSDFDFRLFIGLLLVVDDYGNARASAPYLHGQIAWGTCHSSADLEASLFSLEDVGLVTTYRSRGQTYLHVTNWNKHQKVDKPGKPRVPGLGEPESVPEQRVITYLMQIGDDGPIKIGKTIDLVARLKRLQTSVPHKLTVRKTINSNIETQLHKQFAHLKQTGEWFAPGVDLLAYIAQNDSSNESRTIREDDANNSSNDSSLTGTPTGTVDPDPDLPCDGAAPAAGVEPAEAKPEPVVDHPKPPKPERPKKPFELMTGREQVIETYYLEYERARGEKPPMTGREWKSIDTLVGVLDGNHGRAMTVIRNAFADLYWQGKITINKIANDPAKFDGQVLQFDRKKPVVQSGGWQMDEEENERKLKEMFESAGK